MCPMGSGTLTCPHPVTLAVDVHAKLFQVSGPKAISYWARWDGRAIAVITPFPGASVFLGAR